MGDSVFNEPATERLGNQFFVFDRTAMLSGAAATFTSPGIDTGVGETYSISAQGVRVTSSASIVPAVSTLTINLTYDPDSTFTAAGLTAQNITDMKAANVFAAAQFTNSLMIRLTSTLCDDGARHWHAGEATHLSRHHFADMVVLD
jgi:hypothetical protein